MTLRPRHRGDGPRGRGRRRGGALTSRYRHALTAAALAVATLTGCAERAPEPELPNPASVYCEEVGGQVDIREEPDGSQYGVCVFPDGSECDEWDLYRGDCEPGQQP
jgi:uncharacterized protein